MSFSPSTWRILGLSVATSYVGLGTFALTAPTLAARAFGVYPETTISPSSTQATAVNKAEQAHARAVETSMALLAARDFSIGLALFALDYQRNTEAMGTLILSGMVLGAVDVYYIFKLRGTAWGSLFAAGVGVWFAIGYGLVQK